MITKIDHEVRKAIGISVLAYCILDYIHRSKLDTTAEGICGFLELSILDSWEILNSLKIGGFIEIAPRSGKCSVTAKWKEAVKPAPKGKERAGDPLNHEFRILFEKFKTNYYWAKFSDYRLADEILANLRYKFKVKQNRDGTDKEILASVELVLNSIPNLKLNPPITNVKLLSVYLESILEKIIAGSPKGKIIETAKTISEASAGIQIKTRKDFE